MGPKKKVFCKSQKLEGRYANYFKIGYNAFEFVFDFGQSYSENDQTELCTRIVTGPVYAKAFFKALKDSIETFETTYGSISEEDLVNTEQ